MVEKRRGNVCAGSVTINSFQFQGEDMDCYNLINAFVQNLNSLGAGVESSGMSPVSLVQREAAGGTEAEQSVHEGICASDSVNLYRLGVAAIVSRTAILLRGRVHKEFGEIVTGTRMRPRARVIRITESSLIN